MKATRTEPTGASDDLQEVQHDRQAREVNSFFSHETSVFCSACISSIPWSYERLLRKFVMALFTAVGSSIVEV